MNQQYESSALVDHSGLVKTVATLSESFCLLEFLDLCTLLEGIILHDQLLVVRTDTENGGEGFLKCLYDEKILFDYQIKEPPAYPTQTKEPPKEGYKPAYRVARCSTRDSWYETARIYAAELESEHSALPFNRQQPFYNKLANPMRQHAICNLYSRHEVLAKDLSEVRKAVSIESNNKYIQVPIPPVPLLVLKESKNFTDILKTAIGIREDFTSLREHLRELRAKLADPKIAPNEKQKMIITWKKSWATLDKYKNAANVDIATSLMENVNGSKVWDGLSPELLRIDKLALNVVKLGMDMRSRWRVKTMHRAAKNYLSVPDQGFLAHVERIFGYSLNANDLKKFYEWVKGRKHLNQKQIIDPRVDKRKRR